MGCAYFDECACYHWFKVQDEVGGFYGYYLWFEVQDEVGGVLSQLIYGALDNI